jgi:elongation factor G
VIKNLTENGGEIQDMHTDSSSLSSIGGHEEDVGPFSSDEVYVPPTWVTPSTMSVTDVEGLSRQKRSIYALAPLSKMLDYQSRLRAVSGGQASFEMSRIGFRQVDPARKFEILQEIGRA